MNIYPGATLLTEPKQCPYMVGTFLAMEMPPFSHLTLPIIFKIAEKKLHAILFEIIRGQN